MNAAVAQGLATPFTVSEALLFLANQSTGGGYASLPQALHGWSQAIDPPATNWSATGDLDVYTPTAVAADGSTNYLSGGADFGAASATGAFICFFQVGGGNNSFRNLVVNGSANYRLRLTSANKFECQVRTGGGVDGLVMTSTSSFTPGPAWHCAQGSYNADVEAENHLWIDNVDEKNIVFTGGTPSNGGNINLMADGLGNAKWNGCQGVQWNCIGQTVDFSQESERLKSRNPDGSHRFLGSDGSGQTGTPPQLYWLADVDNILANLGTGGNFTTAHGTFAACATVPPGT